MTVLVALVLVVPLTFLGAILAERVADVIQIVRVLLEEGLPNPPSWLRRLPLFGSDIHRQWTHVAGSEGAFREAAEPYVAQARDWVLRRGASLGEGAIELTLSVVICFFVFRDGRDAAVQCSFIQA